MNGVDPWIALGGPLGQLVGALFLLVGFRRVLAPLDAEDFGRNSGTTVSTAEPSARPVAPPPPVDSDLWGAGGK